MTQAEFDLKFVRHSNPVTHGENVEKYLKVLEIFEWKDPKGNSANFAKRLFSEANRVAYATDCYHNNDEMANGAFTIVQTIVALNNLDTKGDLTPFSLKDLGRSVNWL